MYGFVGNSPLYRFDKYGLDQYKLGNDDPVVHTDPGSGEWNSQPKEYRFIFLKYMIMLQLNSLANQFFLPDASDNLLHFFGNTGATKDVRLQKLIDDVPAAQRVFNYELREAKKFVETLPNGVHDITSGKTSEGDVPKSESLNWYLAINTYDFWGKGIAHVCGNKYKLEFEYKLFDRYNWDLEKSVHFGPYEHYDAFQGLFHLQGLAKEYNLTGTIRTTIEWEK